jgi:hypothetical protein
MGSQEFPGQITADLKEKTPLGSQANGKWRIWGRLGGSWQGGTFCGLPASDSVNDAAARGGPGQLAPRYSIGSAGQFFLIGGRFLPPFFSECHSAQRFEWRWIRMTAVERKRRCVELLNLRASDPLRIIDLYRRVVGLNRFSMLPGAMDYRSLIESIVEFETATGRPLSEKAA